MATIDRRSIFWSGVHAIILLISMLAAPFVPRAGAEQMRVGYGSLSTSYASIWVAGEARLFQKNGIDAEVLYLESALVRSALLTGEIAIGGMSGTTMAAPRLQGGDPILIASFLNSLQYRLVVRPEIRTVADLKGKRVGGRGARHAAPRRAPRQFFHAVACRGRGCARAPGGVRLWLAGGKKQLARRD